MRFAIADPPYPGQAARWYSGHRDYAGEVDHAALMGELGGFDGWALCTSSAAIQEVLALCPAGVRVGVWHRPNSEPPGNRCRWHWMWEPVIFYGWRKEGVTVRDFVSVPRPVPSQIPGEKPREFTRWILHLLGVVDGDEVVDLFPGSGAVSLEISQLVIPA